MIAHDDVGRVGRAGGRRGEEREPDGGARVRLPGLLQRLGTAEGGDRHSLPDRLYVVVGLRPRSWGAVLLALDSTKG